MPDAPPPVHPLGPADRDRLLADFGDWLSTGGQADPDPLDLAALVREVTALRHEVNLGTKAARALADKVSPPPAADDRPLVEALADIADVLRASRDALRAQAPRRWWRRPDPRLAAVGDGYELSLRRVERALTAAGLEPVPAVGEPFDPETMEAVGLADGPTPGVVLTEARRGYRRNGAVFRFARVTVAK